MRASWKLLVAFVAVATASAAVGYFGMQFIRSPADLAAEVSPPPVTRLTADVAAGVVTSTVVMQATVTAGETHDIVPSAPNSGAASIVTKLPRTIGETVRAGDVVAAIADRPVFVLTGAIPLLRSLSLEDRGEDVARLQESLEAAGLEVRDDRGYFGWTTRRAVVAMYENAGYSAPAAGLPLVSSAEIVLVGGSLPARVTALPVPVGMPLGDKAVATLSTSEPRLDAYANPVDAPNLAANMKASVIPPEGEEPFQATIASVGPVEQTENSGFQAAVVLTPDQPVSQELVGQTVQITINTEQLADEGLIVPVSAVFATADGSTSVILVGTDGQETEVAVQVVRTGDGMVQVLDQSGRLEGGMKVVIGAGK